jgi:hypothetical protein
MQLEADLAYFAALIDSASSLHVEAGRRIVLKVRVRPWTFAIAQELARALGFSVAKIEQGAYYRLGFLGSEVGKVFAQVHPHLRTEQAKKHAALAFRFCRTAQKPGVKITEEQRAERVRVIRELATLHKRQTK